MKLIIKSEDNFLQQIGVSNSERHNINRRSKVNLKLMVGYNSTDTFTHTNESNIYFLIIHVHVVGHHLRESAIVIDEVFQCIALNMLKCQREHG